MRTLLLRLDWKDKAKSMISAFCDNPFFLSTFEMMSFLIYGISTPGPKNEPGVIKDSCYKSYMNNK